MDNTFRVIESWRFVQKHGTWPTVGGLDDQPATLVDAVTVLDGELGEFEEREMKRKAPPPK